METRDQDLADVVKTSNPEEINIDDDFASDEEAVVEGNATHGFECDFIPFLLRILNLNLLIFKEVTIEKQPVPGAVFGKLKKADEDDDD